MWQALFFRYFLTNGTLRNQKYMGKRWPCHHYSYMCLSLGWAHARNKIFLWDLHWLWVAAGIVWSIVYSYTLFEAIRLIFLMIFRDFREFSLPYTPPLYFLTYWQFSSAQWWPPFFGTSPSLSFLILADCISSLGSFQIASLSPLLPTQLQQTPP